MDSKHNTLKWSDVKDTGVYVEQNTGDLYRVPTNGTSPANGGVVRESNRSSRMIKISDNPKLPTADARKICENEYSISPNF